MENNLINNILRKLLEKKEKKQNINLEENELEYLISLLSKKIENNNNNKELIIINNLNINSNNNIIKNLNLERLKIKFKKLNETDFNFNYNVFSIKNYNKIPIYTLKILEFYKIYEIFKQNNVDCYLNFFKDINHYYNNNFYHNSYHAIDVMISCNFYLKNNLENNLNKFDSLILLISSFCHDVGHKGFNNQFMITSKSKEALLFNDKSINENLHSLIMFDLLNKKENNILENLNKDQKNLFRQRIIDLILSTDLSFHFKIVKEFENKINENKLDYNKEENKLDLMKIIIKTSDISHSSKNLSLHKIWSRRIIEEFFNQGKEEQKLGFDISPMCDPKNSIYDSQIGFLNFIAKPLFNLMNKISLNNNFKNICIKQMEENIKYWNDEKNKIGKGIESKFINETNF